GDGGRSEPPRVREEGQRIGAKEGADDNAVRRHRAIGYIRPKGQRAGREKPSVGERERQLVEARARRKAQRQTARHADRATPGPEPTTTVTEPAPRTCYPELWQIPVPTEAKQFHAAPFNTTCALWYWYL